MLCIPGSNLTPSKLHSTAFSLKNTQQLHPRMPESVITIVASCVHSLDAIALVGSQAAQRVDGSRGLVLLVQPDEAYVIACELGNGDVSAGQGSCQRCGGDQRGIGEDRLQGRQHSLRHAGFARLAGPLQRAQG